MKQMSEKWLLSEVELDAVAGGLEGGEGFDFVQVNGSNTAGDSFRETIDINTLGGNDRVTG